MNSGAVLLDSDRVLFQEHALLLLIDGESDTAAMLNAGLAPDLEVCCVSTLEQARSELTLRDFQLIVMDPVMGGDSRSMVLLETLPKKNHATPVLLYCSYLPSEECMDRANAVLLKGHTSTQLLSAMVRSLSVHPRVQYPGAHHEQQIARTAEARTDGRRRLLARPAAGKRSSPLWDR